MSYQATSWAVKQTTGSPARKAVLLALANYADERGFCFPKQTTLSVDTEQSIDSVQRHLSKLAAAGIIRMKKRKRPGREYASYVYYLNLNRQQNTPQNAASCEDEHSANISEQAAPSSETGRKLCGSNSKEYPKELSDGESSNEIGQELSDDGREKPVPSEVPVFISPTVPQFAEFQAAWDTSGIDNLKRTLRAWGKLSADERAAAVAGIRPFKAEMERAKRTFLPAGYTYLEDRKWELIAATNGAFIDVLPLTRDWWAWLLHKLDRGDKFGASLQYTLSNTKPIPVKREDMPGLELIRGLEEHPMNGPVMGAWRPWLEARGVRVPVRDSAWVFLPGTNPPPANASVWDLKHAPA